MLSFIGSSLPLVNRGRSFLTLQSSSRRLCRTCSHTVVASVHATKEEVRRIARLAQLEISEEEAAELTPEFQKVIDFFSSMNELDLNNFEPMSTPNDAYNVMREDKPILFPNVDAIMSEAPSIERDYIRVPKIGSEETA